MRSIRIHVDEPLQSGATVRLPEAAAQHVVRVLRMGAGDALVLFNGDGHDYPARLTVAGKREASAEVTGRIEAAAESPLRITLAQAIARGEKMDWVLQKATELGVAAIVPLRTERTEVRLDAERSERRLQHWRGVIVAACEQSGRATVPDVSTPVALDVFAGDVAAEVAGDSALSHAWLVLDPEQGATLDALPDDLRSVTVAIGPEGGWSERELDLLRVAGFTGLRLGPRVLRTETAGVVALAVLQARFGDLG